MPKFVINPDHNGEYPPIEIIVERAKQAIEKDGRGKATVKDIHLLLLWHDLPLTEAQITTACLKHFK